MNKIRLLGYVLAVFCVHRDLSACSLKYDPIAAAHFYRAEGWKLFGTEPDPKGTIEPYLGPVGLQIPGAKAEIIPQQRPFIITFPAQEFELEGKREKMRSMQVIAGVLRWSMNGKVFAYSYSLIPVDAHRKRGKWVIDSEAACIFGVAFIDQTGDGVFRLLVLNGVSADVVPDWVKQSGS